MKIISLGEIKNTKHEVHCPKGGFVSYRFLVEKDNMGFSLHKTCIPTGDVQHWHYKNHLEACYCVAGKGVLTDLATMTAYIIEPDVLYVLDKNDDHTFKALDDVVLLCVFNPPVVGEEVHNEDGEYELKG